MNKDTLSTTLSNFAELENFLFSIAYDLHNNKREFKAGQDISSFLEKNKITIPESLKGEPIEWLGIDANHSNERKTNSISVVRPGNPLALGFTIGCIRIRSWRICLECGWLYCRIVIKGTF